MVRGRGRGADHWEQQGVLPAGRARRSRYRIPDRPAERSPRCRWPTRAVAGAMVGTVSGLPSVLSCAATDGAATARVHRRGPLEGGCPRILIPHAMVLSLGIHLDAVRVGRQLHRQCDTSASRRFLTLCYGVYPHCCCSSPRSCWKIRTLILSPASDP